MVVDAVGLFCHDEDEVFVLVFFFLSCLCCLWEYNMPTPLQLRDEIIVVVHVMTIRQTSEDLMYIFLVHLMLS